MLDIHRIPIWTNQRRLAFLRRWHRDLLEYSGEIRREAFPYRVVESERAQELRHSLEERIPRCRRTVLAAGVRGLRRMAPGERVGEVVEVGLIREVFQLARYNLEIEEVFAVLSEAEDRYIGARARSWIRTLNPLYWLDMLLGVAEMAAFLPVQLAGGNARRLARTGPGTVVRHAVRLGVLVGLAWLALTAVGASGRLLEWGRGFVGGWLPGA